MAVNVILDWYIYTPKLFWINEFFSRVPENANYETFCWVSKKKKNTTFPVVQLLRSNMPAEFHLFSVTAVITAWHKFPSLSLSAFFHPSITTSISVLVINCLHEARAAASFTRPHALWGQFMHFNWQLVILTGCGGKSPNTSSDFLKFCWVLWTRISSVEDTF